METVLRCSVSNLKISQMGEGCTFFTIFPSTLVPDDGTTWASNRVEIIQKYPAIFTGDNKTESDVQSFLLSVRNHCWTFMFRQNGYTNQKKFKDICIEKLIDGLTKSRTTYPVSEVQLAHFHLVSISEDILFIESLCKDDPLDFGQISKKCKDVYIKISTKGPQLPAFVLEQRDKGPGQSVAQYDVQIRYLEMSLMEARDAGHVNHQAPRDSAITVSYTHLTLPTKRIV